MEPEHAIGTLIVNVRNWWVVANLLHVDHTTVRRIRLVGLSQNRIKWLEPVMSWINISK